MNNEKKGKVRTVAVNERGQIVIPEDIRRELGIESSTTLVLIEKDGEIVMKKESEILSALDDNAFWGAVVKDSMRRAWNKEDEVWDKLARRELEKNG